MRIRLAVNTLFLALFVVAVGCMVGVSDNGADGGPGGGDGGNGAPDSGEGDGGGGGDREEQDAGGGDGGPFDGGAYDGGQTGCTSDGDCRYPSGQNDTPYCDVATGECVQCLTDAHCMGGYQCVGHACNYGPKCVAEGGTCRFGDVVYPCFSGESDVAADCPQGALCCVPTAQDGGTADGGPADCGNGFCREAVFSSCGRPDYEPVPGWSCTTAAGAEGYCCLPNAQDGGGPIDGGPFDPCAAVGGYCTADAYCQPGYVMTQMGCGAGGVYGSCCIPAATDGGVVDAGPASCSPGDLREYTCPDYTRVPWCKCVEGACAPKCDMIGTRSEGWYGTCDGTGLITWDNCKGCAAECLQVGTGAEGWYSSCSGKLIAQGACAASWDCTANPESQCTFPCTDNCNCPPDRPICDQPGWGKCVPRNSTSCTNDASLCACGQVCTNGQCVKAPTPCMNSCDCPVGGANPLVCVNGACVQKKDPTCNGTPCPCGQVCTNVGPTTKCVAGCYENCDCPADMPFCALDPTGTGKCAPGGVIKCGPNGEGCPCGQVCAGDKCYDGPQRCTDNCDCRDMNNPICRNGVCGKAVNGQFDCPCGVVCGF